MGSQNMLEPGYNPFTDASFLIALVLGGGSLVLGLLAGIPWEHPVSIVNGVLWVVWQSWIFYKKGKKWSLVVGLVLGLAAAGLAMVGFVQIDASRQAVQMQRTVQQYEEKIQQQMEEKLRQQQTERQGPPR